MIQNPAILLTLNPKAKLLMALYDAHGYGIRLIGGCVRDVMMGNKVGDCDLATTATPEQSMRLLEKEGIRCIPTGLQHGTITALLDNVPFEITTLRRDVATNGRHAQVAYTDNWQEDAARRDFTINAMAVDLSGTLHDYWEGKNDLKNQHLRFIGDPHKRIREDFLRILRYFRFISVFNWPFKDKEASMACSANRLGLKKLSRERIQREIYKLLLGSGAVRVVESMIQGGLWEILTKQSPNIENFKRLVALEKEHKQADPLRRLLALGNHTDTVWLDKMIVLSNKDKKRIDALNKLDPNAPLNAQLYKHGKDTVTDSMFLTGNMAQYNQIQNWRAPVFPILAIDIMKFAGDSPPRIGMLLKAGEQWWIDENFEPSYEEIMKHIELVASQT